MPGDIPPARSWQRVLPPLLVALLAAGYGSCALYNPDLGAYIARGELTLAHGSIPPASELLCTGYFTTFTQAEKWGFQVLLAATWRAGGMAGLYALRSLLIAALVLVAWRLARPRAGPAPDWIAGAVIALALTVANERLDLRPELVSYILLAVCLQRLEAFRRTGGRAVWFLPLLFVLWVNLHTYFPLGLAAIAAYAAALGVEARYAGGRWRPAPSPAALQRLRTLLAVGVAAVAACFVNPRGADGVLFPFVLSDWLAHEPWYARSIFEFLPPFTPEPFPTMAVAAYKVLLITLAAVTLVWPWTRRGRDASAPETAAPALPEPGLAPALFAAACVLQSLSMRRHVALAAIGSIPYLSGRLSALAATLAPRCGPALGRRLAAAATALLALAVLALDLRLATGEFYVAERSPRRPGFALSTRIYPVAAEALLERERIEGPCFAGFETGSYLMWRAPGRRRPIIDSISDHTSLDLYALYRALMAGVEPHARAAAVYGIDYAVLRHAANDAEPLLAALGRDPDWRLVHLDWVSAVFLRRGGRYGAVAERLALDPAACPLPPEPAGERGFDLAQRHWWLGRALATLGAEARAQEELRAAIRCFPEYPEALGDLAERLARAGRRGEAEPLLRAALAAKPDYLPARHNLGMLLLEEGKTPAALELLAETAALHPLSPLAWNALGRANGMAGRYAEAARCYERTVEIEPADAEARSSLVYLYTSVLRNPARAQIYARPLPAGPR